MKRPAFLNTKKRPAARAVGRFVFLMLMIILNLIGFISHP